MRQARARDDAFAPALVIHDAAILLAVFYAPIFWGGFGTSGQTMAATLVSVAVLCAVVWRWGVRNRGPAVIPNAVHLPALLLLLTTLVTSWFSANHHASSLEFSRIASSVMLFLLVANRALMPAAPALPVMAVFASSLLVIPFVHSSGESGPWLDGFTGLAMVCIGALLITRRHAPDPVRRWVEALALSAGLAVALLGFREKVITYLMNNPTWNVFSTFFNPNELAGFLVLVIPVALALFLAPQKRWSRLITGFACFALLVIIVPTNSKAGYLALAIGLAVFAALLALISRRPRRNAGLVLGGYAVGALGVVALLTASSALRAKALVAFDPQSASNMFRLLTWKGTLLMASHHLWLGIGPAAFKSVYPNYTVVGYTEAAHQDYLQMFAEQGVLGALVFLWLLGAILFTGWRALRRPGADRGSQLLAAGGMAGVIALMAHSCFDYGWYIGATNLTLWFIAGMLAHLSHGRALAAVAVPTGNDPPRGKRRRAAEAAPPPPAPAESSHSLPWPRASVWRGLLVICLAGLLCLCLWTAGKNALAQDAMSRADTAMAGAMAAEQQGDLSLARQRYQESLPLYRAAAEADPTWSGIHEKLGLTLRDEEGEQHLKRAVALEPRNWAPRLSLARFYDGKKRYPEAVQAFQESLARFPQNTRALRLLAETYQKMGEEEKALDTYRRVADLDDEPINRYGAIQNDVDVSYAYAYYELGRAELRALPMSSDFRKLEDTALSWFEKCAAIADDYFRPGGAYTIDELFAKAGKPRANRGEELLPLKAKALWRMSEILDRQGRRGKAAAARNEAAAAAANVTQLLAEEDRGELK